MARCHQPSATGWLCTDRMIVNTAPRTAALATAMFPPWALAVTRPR